MKVVSPLNEENKKHSLDTENKKVVDISKFEDVEDDDDYSAPCVLAYDEGDSVEESN